MTIDDALYQRAVDLVLRTRAVSVSAIQRNLQIGFTHALGYIEEMQSLGIVSAPDSAGRRTVLVGSVSGVDAKRADSTRRSAAPDIYFESK